MTDKGGFSDLKRVIGANLASDRSHSPNLDGNCGLIECGIDIVNWDGIEGIGSIAADVDDNRQLSRFPSRGNGGMIDEVRDLRGEVNAVDKDVDVENLSEGTALGSLCQIPLEDIISDTQKFT